MAPDVSRCPTTLRSVVAALFIGSHVVYAQECNYEGGWALRNAGSCPPSAPIECGTGAQPRCCPSGFACTGDGDYVGNYCCSDPKDCRELSLQHPKCPDSTWTLWGVDGKLDNGGWCCMNGFNGTYRNSGGIALLCTPSTATTLSASQFWAEPVSTTSCSVTSTSSAATTTTAATGTAASATPTGTGAFSPAESTGAAASNDESTGMSGGAKAGAAIGGVAGVALIGAAFFFMWRRKKRNAAAAAAAAPTGNTGQGGWAYDEQKAKFGHGYEQGGPNELATEGARSEMDGTVQPTFELDATHLGNAQELDSTPASTRLK